jgi:HD-GYP domain-containing protein (c-di-GMP phosphodiesterase class II)
MQLLKLVQNQVRVDEPLPWNIRDASGQLLLAKGFVLHGQPQLEALLDRGVYVDIEEVRAARRAAEEAAARAPNLFGQWERLLWRLDKLLRHIDQEADFTGDLDQLALDLAKLVDRDADIAIYLAVRQDQKRFPLYGLTHAIHTATICLLLTRRIGWPAERVHALIQAALVMNVSVLELQGRLCAQGVPPTEPQKAVLREHPLRSAAMLRAAGLTDAAILLAVEQHHERVDGSGYPQALTDLDEMAVALGHADVFMAKISPRALRAALPTQQAARELFAQGQGSPVASALIKELGIYPPGDFVKLKSGECAVVVRRGADARTPLAASITNRDGMPTVNTVQRDTARPEFAITGAINDKSLVLRMPPERLYGLPE